MDSDRSKSGPASAYRPWMREDGQVVEPQSDFGVIGAERLLSDGERSRKKRLRLCITALVLIQQGEIVQRGTNIAVVGTQCFLADRPTLMSDD
jgi:hypothetical protein